MPVNREVVASATPVEINRRGVLKGAASLAVCSVMLGRHRVAQALGAFNPYAIPVNTGPSNAAVPAIGATAAAPATPYVVPIASGWSSTALLTTGNTIHGYRMAGTPDGLGAFDNGDRTITLCMNHEFAADSGAMRAHGGTGAFVSRWLINKDTLEIVSGRDFVDAPQKLHLWTGAGWKTANRLAGDLRKINRLCSSDLAPISAFYNAASKRGYEGQLLLTGEEAFSRNARAFAFVIESGAAYELPAFAFGNRNDRLDPSPSWENLLANPATGEATVVMALSDGGTNQVYIYLGTKRSEGSPVEKAGLAGGRIFSLRVAGVRAEDRTGNVGLAKSLRGRGEGKRIGLAAPNRGTSFLRPEDGAWDPRNPNVFYFVTTDRQQFRRRRCRASRPQCRADWPQPAVGGDVRRHQRHRHRWRTDRHARDAARRDRGR